MIEAAKKPPIQKDGVKYEEGIPEGLNFLGKVSDGDIPTEEVDGYCVLCGIAVKIDEVKCRGCEEPVCLKCRETPEYFKGGLCSECLDVDDGQVFGDD